MCVCMCVYAFVCVYVWVCVCVYVHMSCTWWPVDHSNVVSAECKRDCSAL